MHTYPKAATYSNRYPSQNSCPNCPPSAISASTKNALQNKIALYAL